MSMTSSIAIVVIILLLGSKFGVWEKAACTWRKTSVAMPAQEKGGVTAAIFLVVGLGCLILTFAAIVGFLASYAWKPTLGDVAQVIHVYAFAIAGFLAIMYSVGTSLPKTEGKDGKKEAKALCHVLHGSAAGLAIFLFAIIPFLWMVQPSSTGTASTGIGCKSAQYPCSLNRQTNGLTETVTMQDGQQVCFDYTFWRNLDRLGYWTSYHHQDARKYGCTRDQVVAGKCSERMGTEFWFQPEPGVPLPKYWITPNGASC